MGARHDEKEMADTRAYVFDPYNTDGDCLADK
jgi:hypothetical protein